MSSALAPTFQLIGDHPELEGWRRALAQDRQQFIEGPRSVSQDGSSATVAIAAGEAPPWWREHCEAGGSLVLSAATRLPWESSRRPVTFGTRLGWREVAALPGPRVIASDLEGDGELQAHEDRIPKAAGSIDTGPVVSRHEFGRGQLLVVWAPVGQGAVAMGDRLRCFANWSPVTERISAIDKAELVSVMTDVLADAVTGAGLRYVVPNHYPRGRRSVLVVRVDVDGVYGDNTRRIDRAFGRHDIPVSFFVNASYSEAHPGDLNLNRDLHQIGQHGHTHDVFETVEENNANLAAGERWFEDRFGTEPRGFVAPRGLWNSALEQALLNRGYRYSSDFGLDIDGLPFRTPRGLLQLPVHPYSPERAAVWAQEQDLAPPSAETIVAHYEVAAQRQVARGYPVHVYGHPQWLGVVADELALMLAELKDEHHLEALTLDEWAAWWEEREQSDPPDAALLGAEEQQGLATE